MRVRYDVCLVFIVVFTAVLFYCIFSQGYPLSVEENSPSFFFRIQLGQVDWATRRVDTVFEVFFVSLPGNLGDIMAEYNVGNNIAVKFQQWHNVGEIILEPQFEVVDGEKRLTSLQGSLSNPLNFRGPSEYYPLDQYMLNITFSLPSFGIINESNVILKPEDLCTEFELRTESGTQDDWFTVAYLQTEKGEEIILNTKVFLYRSSSTTNLIISVLVICYLLIGSIPLIKPEKMEHRISVCLSLFLFAVSFTFTISIQALAGTTLAGNLIFILLVGAGAFSVVSVVEKALIETKQKLTILQFPIEGIVILLILSSLNNALTSIISSPLAADFPWVSLSPYLPLLLVISLLYGYISVTLAFIINRLRKRVSTR
ncbi:MAG: hypothetical protein QXF52_09890 [Thermoproteota archaeon]